MRRCRGTWCGWGAPAVGRRGWWGWWGLRCRRRGSGWLRGNSNSRLWGGLKGVGGTEDEIEVGGAIGHFDIGDIFWLFGREKPPGPGRLFSVVASIGEEGEANASALFTVMAEDGGGSPGGGEAGCQAKARDKD